MAQEPNWPQSEFEILMNNPELSDEELHKKLPRRSLGAIRIVRVGIHRFHTGKSYDMLSRMMINKLKKKQHAIMCHECSKEF